MSNIKIEILYPEHCHLYGDIGNEMFLKKSLPDAEFIMTPLNIEPKFLTEDVNLVYMGPTTEKTQVLVIDRLMKHKDTIKEKIDSGMAFLFTGNSLEILGNYIQEPSGNKVPALGIFDLYAKQDKSHRLACPFLGEALGMKMTGYKNQFTTCYLADESISFMKVEKGIGLNNESKFEGIHVNNFFGTHLIGPFLVLNPYFGEYLLNLIGVENPQIPFRKEAIEAYDQKIADFSNPKLGY